jgi:hemoglobin/transferrin/lactoferrin receptor protein
MAGWTKRTNALLLGCSSLVLLASNGASPADAQSMNLDPITVMATKTPEQTTESLAAVSSVRQDQLDQTMASRPSDVLWGIPGVWSQDRVDDPGSAINIRGLQDFGRVAVTIDGARQNFQRTGHAADGIFYLEPELLAGADVVRGPVANIYGSGAIGGVVSFRTKDVDDILRSGQQWAVVSRGEIGSNEWRGVGSTFLAARINPNAEVMFGVTGRTQSDYRDGDGNTIPNTGSRTETQIAKLTVRPADGHQVKLSFINYDTKYVSGQPFIGTGLAPNQQLSSIFDTKVNNRIATAGWTYSRPDDRIFDFDGKIYWSNTSTDQTKTGGDLPPPFAIGNIGDKRNFTINTYGFDVHNNSRFDTGPIHHTVTVGGDAFRDYVDTSGFGVVFTPSGERTVSGAFVQFKSDYAGLLEVIGAARYDNYSLQGGNVSASGDRISPKITVGLTPIRGITPYVTYAEGYRAPAVTETLVSGIHPIFFAPFEFLPNPGLKPETGKTKEVGLNLRFDNIIRQGDAFRAKANVYRNDVEDFIEFVPLSTGQTGQGGITCTTVNVMPGPDCEQYQNITRARLDGFEWESNYDAGDWFAGFNYSHVRGKNVSTGQPLAKIPPDMAATTLGVRLLDRKLTLAVRWQAVAAKELSDIPISSGQPVFPPTDAFNLVNLYAGYEVNPDLMYSLSVENLLNEQYSLYLSSFPNPSGRGSPIAMPSPGITVRGAIKVRFGDDFFNARKG